MEEQNLLLRVQNRKPYPVPHGCMGAHTDQIRAENHSLLKLVPAHRASVPWAWPVPSCQTSLLGWPSRDNLWGQ